MKKLALVMAVVLALGTLLIACDTTAPVTSTPTEQETAAPTTIDQATPEATTPAVDEGTPTPTPTPTPVSNDITVAYVNKAGSRDVSQTGEGSVNLAVGSKLSAGDKITVTLAEGQKLFFLKISKSLEEALIYAPEGTYTFTAPSDMSAYYPSNIMLNIEARYPTQEELTTKRNLALNPLDTKATKSDSYPHATSTNNWNTAEFGPHCAIDGFTNNKGHGTYPLQSWGPSDNVKKTDRFVIDFGREVNVSELVLYIRADFSTSGTSHDAFFSEITVKFSDGSSVVINPTKTASAQTFQLGDKTTTSITLTGFVTDKTNSSGWAALTEVQVMGTEKVA